MKLDVLISIIDGERRSRTATKINLASPTANKKFNPSPSEALANEEEGPGYSVDLSGEEPSHTQLLSEQVQSQNEAQAENLSSLPNQSGRNPDIPPSLTSVLQKPGVTFEEFFKRMVQDPRS